MGRKGGAYKRKESSGESKRKATPFPLDDEDMMNDEIDAFHKHRDVVPMRLDEDMEESDKEDEKSVFDIEDDDEGDDDDEVTEIDDPPSKGFLAKLQRTEKNLKTMLGGVEDEISDDAHEEEQERVIWGGQKYGHGADVANEPLSSDDEDAAEEEAEVLRLQSEKAKAMSMEDYGLEDTGDAEPTLEESLDQGKTTSRPFDQVTKEETGLMYEIVKKDLNTLTKEEQMDVVFSSAPELVGLLSELNDALEQLESKFNPVLNKIREQESTKKGVMHYIEVKQLLLQAFCQAITFYLLLKAEGQPVRDHPVVSRLVEIKSLLDKMKELDENLPSDLEDILNKNVNHAAVLNLLAEEIGAKEVDSFNKAVIISTMSSVKHAMLDENRELTELNTTRSSKYIEPQQKCQDVQVGVESLEMLKVRAALEEKLKQKGVLSSAKNVRRTEYMELVNGQLETLNDFGDEAIEMDRCAYGKSIVDENKSSSRKLSQQLYLRLNKRKVISGDDDVPKRDDIGERRRKYEMRVLAGAGVISVDNLEDATNNLSNDRVSVANRESDPDLEYYKQVEQQHAVKLSAKINKYSRNPEISSLPDDTVDGKRLITHQMEKNRGLTRSRKKLIKNPRKKYKLKHQKAEVRRKGQVREVRKPTGPYGGEATGINSGISRSIRFKS